MVRRRGQLSRECVVGVASYFSFHRINEEMALDVLLTPLPSRRNQFAPGKLVRTPIVGIVPDSGNQGWRRAASWP